MSTDTDGPIEARVASIESSVEQINTRLGRLESEVTGLRSDTSSEIQQLRSETSEDLQQMRTETREEFRQLRTELRRWIIVLFAGLSLVFTLLQILL